MRTHAAKFIGKSIALTTRKFKLGGGSAAPGLYALKIDPNLVSKLVKDVPLNVVITGTNGKTTTARMLTHLAKANELKVIRNSTGSNLERGVASALIQGGNLKKYDLGIWELDEAAFNKVIPKLKPDLVLFLNVSRDQLDRYGEVDKVIKHWCETLSTLDPKTKVLVNRDDPSLDKLKDHFKGRILEFGKNDVKDLQTHGLDGSSFKLSINNDQLNITLPIPGLYHVYDAVAAINAAFYLNLPVKQLTDQLADFKPAFGRVEKFDFGYIFLIKNPAGTTAVLETISPEIKKEDTVLIALNDDFADGLDVSWIWDGNFEELTAKNIELNIVCSGSRAYDMAVRLKYAGFETSTITVEPNLKRAFKEATKGLKGQLYVLPTYTALLEIQSILAKTGHKKHYWQED
jgi:lipid II isoglutaminyl synthase (glutamine-hydrolysing)